MIKNLYTIGYEGSEVSNFITTLSRVGITHLIDIRDIPASRKYGFSKNALALNLNENEISYTHLKALGDPKPGREAMRRGNYKEFLKIYIDRLEEPEAQSCLNKAIEIASGELSVLLCFERDPKLCHRTLVAGRMRELAQFQVTNLGVNVQDRLKPKGRAMDGNAGATHAIG